MNINNSKKINNIDTFLYSIDNKIEYIEISNSSELENKETYPKNKKNIYCGNCGKKGHIYRKCHFPVMSMGIICIKIDKININSLLKKSYSNNRNDYTVINKYLRKNLKFLLIKRKHSLGFVEFIRGKYDFDNIEYLINIFSLMPLNEIDYIKTNNFENLWNNLWNIDKPNRNHISEYDESQSKFNKLKKGVFVKFNKKFKFKLNLKTILNMVENKWNETEWGFPKGRRNLKESDLDCAIREFNEETNYTSDDYELIDINPIIEKFIGTNGVRYQHTYYIAQLVSNKEPIININNYSQVCEIGDMGWFTYEESKQKIRNYNIDRILKLDNIYNLIKLLLVEYYDKITF